MGYAEVKLIYDTTRLDMFVLAISHLMDIGFRNAAQITDEDIEATEGNGIMTQSFCQELNRMAREIANCCEPSELVQLCQAEDVFDVKFSAEKIGRNRLETLCYNAVCYMSENQMSNKDIASYICADEYEMEMLGYPLEEVENED